MSSNWAIICWCFILFLLILVLKGLIGTVLEKQRVGALVSTVSEEQIWRGPFILPSDGEITTGYGLQRYYNGVFAEK